MCVMYACSHNAGQRVRMGPKQQVADFMRDGAAQNLSGRNRSSLPYPALDVIVVDVVGTICSFTRAGQGETQRV